MHRRDSMLPICCTRRIHRPRSDVCGRHRRDSCTIDRLDDKETVSMLKRMFAALLMLAPALCAAEKVAVTFDDLPLNGSLPAGVTEVDIVKRVLPIFEQRKLPPMYGFINARKLESSPAGAQALRLWAESR
jgi:hypothetical protein